MKWYYKPVFVFLAILLMGPIAIPLVVKSPAFKRWQKTLIIIMLVLITIWSIKLISDIYGMLIKELDNMNALLKQ